MHEERTRSARGAHTHGVTRWGGLCQMDLLSLPPVATDGGGRRRGALWLRLHPQDRPIRLKERAEGGIQTERQTVLVFCRQQVTKPGERPLLAVCPLTFREKLDLSGRIPTGWTENSRPKAFILLCSEGLIGKDGVYSSVLPSIRWS